MSVYILPRGNQVFTPVLYCTYYYCNSGTSHCEIKSHRIWLIWKAIPIKIFKISQNFQTILQQILWRNKHKSHTVIVFTSFLHKKVFRPYWGSSKVMFKKITQNFFKSPLKSPLQFCLVSQISPQLMACMYSLMIENDTNCHWQSK